LGAAVLNFGMVHCFFVSKSFFGIRQETHPVRLELQGVWQQQRLGQYFGRQAGASSDR
jgi:hypothetical protein